MIRILVAEDQKLVRRALVALLAMEEGIEVVAEAEDGQVAVEQALHKRPDVALLDIEMPRLSGLEAVRLLHEQLPSCRTLVVTTFARPGYLQRALKSGAAGYMSKDADVTDVCRAIRAVHAGERVFDPQLMAEALVMENPLSLRELEVLRHAARGLSTRELAVALSLGEGTVRNYLSEIMSKLFAQTRQEAVHIAREHGWL